MCCTTGVYSRASYFSFVYINDLSFVSDVLDPIMFADDTNLFYSHKDINTLFLKVNNRLHKINQWFTSNKLSLNVKKYIYIFIFP